MCAGMLTHFKNTQKSPAELCNTTLHSSTIAQWHIIKTECVCACVWEWVGEGAVCLWLAFQTSSLHKITSWEDNLRACDNLFRLTFLQSVKATDQWRGSARDQWVCASYFCLETLCQHIQEAHTDKTGHTSSSHLLLYMCHLTYS